MKLLSAGALFCVGQQTWEGCKGHISGIRRVEIDVAGFRESNVVLDSGKSRPDEQRKGKIWVGGAVWAAQLEAPVLAGGGGTRMSWERLLLDHEMYFGALCAPKRL